MFRGGPEFHVSIAAASWQNAPDDCLPARGAAEGAGWFGAIPPMLRDPLREWQERYAESGTHLGFKPETGTRFSSAVRAICDSPRVVRTVLSPGLLYRDRAMVGDGDDNLSLVISLGPELNVWHRNREIRLGRNEATMMQADAPGKAGTRRRFEVLEVRVPQSEWSKRGSRSGDALVKLINRNSESLKLLLGYAKVLAKAAPVFPQARDAVQSHLIDLTVLAATAPSLGESEAGCVVAARRATVLEYIAAHFRDPGLSGSGLAQSLGISQRYLQRLLQGTGNSFTGHVNELRLQRAFALLSAGGDRRVSDIAFDVGFSDLAHFYRLFKSRFGDTPKRAFGSKGAPQPD
jgi:AraC-like DNA-binding protein